MKEQREIIKEEFKYYLANAVRSARRTSEGINLGRTAVDSFLSFLEPNRLFDYAPEKWSHIKSMYDITSPQEVKQITEMLLNDKEIRIKVGGLELYPIIHALLMRGLFS